MRKDDTKMPLLHKNVKYDKEFKRVYGVLKRYVSNKDYVETVNPKIERLLDCLQSHFLDIIWLVALRPRLSCLRSWSTVVDIVESINGVGHIKAHQFVGQSDTSTG